MLFTLLLLISCSLLAIAFPSKSTRTLLSERRPVYSQIFAHPCCVIGRHLRRPPSYRSIYFMLR
jgi:hypothetical protein